MIKGANGLGRFDPIEMDLRMTARYLSEAMTEEFEMAFSCARYRPSRPLVERDAAAIAAAGIDG